MRKTFSPPRENYYFSYSTIISSEFEISIRFSALHLTLHCDRHTSKFQKPSVLNYLSHPSKACNRKLLFRKSLFHVLNLGLILTRGPRVNLT